MVFIHKLGSTLYDVCAEVQLSVCSVYTHVSVLCYRAHSIIVLLSYDVIM